jgi:micrococcal nuclease
MNVQYKYRGYVSEIYDGDTITANLNLGFGIISAQQKIRLHGLNAPELRGENKAAGLVSRDYLRSLILNKEVVIETFKDGKGKYGRYIAKIWSQVGCSDKWECINDKLVEDGYALAHEY